MSLDKNYQGTDVNLETSLEEYGFVARPITVDYADEYFVIYKMDDNQYGSGHIRESELDAIVKGTEWASEEDVNSMLETVGASKEEWFDLSFVNKFSDLVSYWGTENIMGTDYYPNDKNWAFEEIGLESDSMDLDDLVDYVVPTHYATALINGDYSGLSDEEEQELNEFTETVIERTGNANFMLGNNDEGEYFSPANDINNLGSTVMKVYIRPSDSFAKGGEIKEWENSMKKRKDIEFLRIEKKEALPNNRVMVHYAYNPIGKDEFKGTQISTDVIQFANGGGVGEDVSKSLYVEKFYGADGEILGYTIRDKFNPTGKYTLSSKKERAEENRKYLIDNPSSLAYYRKNEYSKGGGVKIKSAFRLYNSPLIKFANFKDGSHINLMRLIKPYKNGEKYGISKISINKIGDEVRIFKTLEDAESYFDRIVNQKKKSVDLREEVGTTNNYGKGGILGADARLEYVTDAYASGSLQEELKEKLGIETDSLGDNYVISFAYTDYGGDFIDKVAIAYFKENYPNNTLFENAGYNGENAYVFGEPAKEWIETTQDYPLGFEDIEDFYYEKQNEQENEDFNYFLDEIKSDYSFDRDEALQWLNENRGGYFGMTTQGLDFSFQDLTNDLVNEGVIEPNEEDEDEFAKGGGVGNEKPYQVYNYETQNIEGYFDNEMEAEEFASKFKNATVYDTRQYANGGGVEDKDNLEKLWIGYASAILFAEMDDNEESLDSNYYIEDFDTKTIKSSKDLIRKFYFDNKKAIEDSGMDLDTIGNDIWYTRAGHGAGFFDHNLDKDVEDKLTKGAKLLGEYPNVEIYDGKISVTGGRVFNDYAKGGGVGNSLKIGDKVKVKNGANKGTKGVVSNTDSDFLGDYTIDVRGHKLFGFKADDLIKYAEGGDTGYSKKDRVIDYYYQNDVFDDYETYGLSEDDLNNEDKVVKSIIKYHGLNKPENVEERFETLFGDEDEDFAKGGGVGKLKLLSDKFEEVGYETYARNFGVVQIGGFNNEEDINILVSANIVDMSEATGDDKFEEKPYMVFIETHAYPKFWSDEYADNVKDMVGDDDIDPRSIDYLSDAHSYGLGVPLSTYADDKQFETEEEAIDFLNSKKLSNQISGLGMLSGFHFDKQYNRIGDTGWSLLYKQIGANEEEYARGGSVEDKDNLEKLWNGYASAILFAENDSDTEEPLDGNYSISDFDEETVKSSKDLIRKFYFDNKKAIENSGMDLDTIGNDIWYTRAGHGAGFFDHNLDKDVEDKLTKGAKLLGEYPNVETYDGKISVTGGRVFNDYAKGGGVEQNLEVGNIVELSESGWDNESYHDFFNGVDDIKLVVTNVYTGTSEHQGFDSGIGMALYSLERLDDGTEVPFDLYDYELEYVSQGETFAKGGGVRISVLNELYNLKDKGVTQVQLNGFSENIGYVIGLRLDDTEIEKVGNNAYITLYKNGGGVGYYKGIKKEDIISKTIVYDNPETFDRYTVFTPDGSVFGMSENASGFNQYVGEDSEIQKGKHLGRKLKSVPTGIEWAILDRMKEEYADGGGVEERYILKDVEEDETTEFSAEELKEYIADWNNSMETDYEDWKDFNKGEEYYKITPISKHAKGGGVDDYIDAQSKQFRLQSKKKMMQYERELNIKNTLEIQGFLALNKQSDRLNDDYLFYGESFSKNNLMKVLEMFPNADSISFDGVIMAKSDNDYIDDVAIYFEVSKLKDSFANGGEIVRFLTKENERLSRPSGSIEKEILDKVIDRFEPNQFVGSIGWRTPQDKLADGYLYKLDDFDKNLVSNIKLKETEKIFRYFNRTTAIGGMTPLIKINLKNGMLYFAIYSDSDDVQFETKGVKALWVSIIEDNIDYANGGDVGKERFNLHFNYNPSNLSNEDAEKIVEQYTKDWKHDNDWDNVSFYVFNLTKEKADELKAELKMEDTFNIEIEKSRNSFANGGGVDDYFTMKDGSKMSKVEWYKKMEDKLGFEKLAERILKDSQFGQKINTPSNELTHNRLNKKAIIGKKSVTISSYTPNYNRYLDSKTFDNLKELDDYLNENQILADGGGVDGKQVNQRKKCMDYFKSQGYYVNLLYITDVQNLYDVDNETAYDILDRVSDILASYELVKNTIYQVKREKYPNLISNEYEQDWYANGGGVDGKQVNQREKCMDYFKSQGYYVNLLYITDVQNLYNVDNETAYNILDRVSDILFTYEKIKSAIYQVKREKYPNLISNEYEQDWYANGGGVDDAKYKVILKSDKHYGQVGFNHYGIETDNKGVSFVSLEFPNGVNTYSINEVERVYADGGGVGEKEIYYIDWTNKEPKLSELKKKYLLDSISFSFDKDDVVIDAINKRHIYDLVIIKGNMGYDAFKYNPDTFNPLDFGGIKMFANGGGVEERYILKDVEEDETTEFSAEELKEYIADWNNSMGTDYEDWKDFNNGEEYYKITPISRNKKSSKVQETYILKDVEEDETTEFSAEELKEYIADWNNSMKTDYEDWKDFNKGEEYYKITPISKHAKGGGVDGRTGARLDNIKTFRVTKEDTNDKVVYTKDYDTFEEALNDSYTPHKEGGMSWVRGCDKDNNFIKVFDRRSHWGKYKKYLSNEEDEDEDFADGGGVSDWFWNHDYRHYLRDASPKKRSIVKQKFIDKGLKLDGSSPQHAYIVISTIKPSELKKYKKVGSDGIDFNGDFAGGYKFSNGGGVDDADWIEESLIDLQNEVDMDDLVVENSDNNRYTASNGNAEFIVYKTEDDARERAIERVKEDLEENPEYFSKNWLMNYIDGEDFFTEAYNELNESYANDIESEDSDKYANRLIEEMVENGIVSSEEAKEDDFDAEDYKDAFVELMTSNQMWEDNGLQHYIDNFGEEQAFKVVLDNYLIDIDEASESAVDTDGVAHFLSWYDGEQIDLSNGHVAYRTN